MDSQLLWTEQQGMGGGGKEIIKKNEINQKWMASGMNLSSP